MAVSVGTIFDRSQFMFPNPTEDYRSGFTLGAALGVLVTAAIALALIASAS